MHLNLLKILTVLLTLTFLQLGFSQSPTTYFDDNNPNIEYLEHLIKKGIDEVRTNLGLKPLVNDSILYIAAGDHAHYLSNMGRLSHYQTQNPSKKTPQLRAEFYGARNYNVGENVASTSYGSTSETYADIAKVFVTSWVNSPGHYANIITPTYEVTGLHVSMDKGKRILYACQKFAHVELRFIFEENESMFPYSNYTPPPQVTSFDKIPNNLIPKYKYPYKLRHDKLEKCDRCPDYREDLLDMSLEYDERKGFVIRIENTEYVKQLIRHKWDGFAVEIVGYDDYACGSPFYYEKPSRRNSQLLLNGKTLEPKYRKELLNGFKKRKKIESVNFFPYIFRRDSVNFFRRFGEYKMDKYTSQYFEISLGKLPKNGPRLIDANLVIIQDKQICDVIYFSPICGNLYEEYVPTDFIPFQYDDAQYKFKIKPDELSFSIPFEQGQDAFEKETILKNISSLSEYDFFIDSVKIHAFSSVEGDSAVNARLQIKRGESIAEIFQGIQAQEIERNIMTSINWEDFRKELAKGQGTRALTRLSNKDLLAEVNRDQKRLEPQLATTRRGDVKVFFHVLPNLKSLKYYIENEWTMLVLDVETKNAQRVDAQKELDQIADLYKYTYSMVKQGHLDPSFFLKLKLPKEKDKNLRLMQYHLLFGFEYPSVFSQLKEWKKDSTVFLNKYKTDNKTDFIPTFNYLLIKLISDDIIKNKTVSKDEYQLLSSKAIQSKEYYFNTEEARINMDKINFNLNMLTLNYYFKTDPKEHKGNAMNAISQVYEYYVKNDLLYDTLAINMSYMAAFYQASQLGIKFIFPYKSKDQKIHVLINELGYYHPSIPGALFYYQDLIADSYVLPANLWCNMFIKPCGISFQAFDHEALRNRYCELCEGENDYLNEIYFNKK